MASLFADYVPLAKLADALPDGYQLLRYHLQEGNLPARRDENGRLFVEREFALRLQDTRPDFDRLSHTIAHLNHERN